MNLARLKLAALAAVVVCGALSAELATACPVDIDQSGVPITDGMISVDYINSGVTDGSFRGADDFYLPVSPSGYYIPQVVVYLICLNSFLPGDAQIEFFTQGFNGTRAVPATREFIHVGATSVVDEGAYFFNPQDHIYRVTFDFGLSGGAILAAGKQHWLSPSVLSIVNLPNFPTAYAAAHSPVSFGASMAKNSGYPTGPWTGADDCCGFDPSDMVFRLIAIPIASALSDFNCSGDVTVQDLFDYLQAYFAKLLTADINANGSLTVQDLFDFLSFFFAKK